MRQVDGVHELGLLALALVAQLVVQHVLVDDAVHVRLQSAPSITTFSRGVRARAEHDLLDRAHHVHPGGDAAEDDVLAVEACEGQGDGFVVMKNWPLFALP